MTLESAESPGERCLAYRVADELTERLRHAAPAGWVVLNRHQVLRVEDSVFGDGMSAASRVASKLPASRVLFGTVQGDAIKIKMFDAHTVKAAELESVKWVHKDTSASLQQLLRGVLEKMDVSAALPKKPFMGVPYPDDDAACVLLGETRASMKRGNVAFLEGAYQALVQVSTGPGTSPRLKALLLEVQGRLFSLKKDASNHADMEKKVAELVSQAPDMVETHWVRGLIKDFAGRTTQAIAAYRRASVLDPGFSDPRVNLGRRLLKAGRLAGAITVLEEAVVLDPNWAGALHNYSWALTKAGDGWGALRYLDRLLDVDEGSRASVLPLKVLALIQVGRIEEALAHVRGSKSSKTWSMRLLEALALLAGGDYTDALDHLNALLGPEVKLEGLSADSQEAVLNALANKGRALAAMGLTDKARQLYLKQIQNDPDIRHPQLRAALAVLEATDKGAEDKARQLLAEIVELDWWAGDEAWYNLAVLRHRSGEYGLAAEAYEKAVAENSRASWAFYNLALVRMEQGEHDAAAHAFRRVLELDPRAGDAANGLGVALCRAGNPKEGVAVWRQWLEDATRLKPAPSIPPIILENLGAVGTMGR